MYFAFLGLLHAVAFWSAAEGIYCLQLKVNLTLFELILLHFTSLGQSSNEGESGAEMLKRLIFFSINLEDNL